MKYPKPGKEIPYPGSNSFDAVLADFIMQSFGHDFSNEITRYQILFIKKVKLNGKKEAARFLKALYTYAVKFSLDYRDINPIPWTKSDKEGFPKCINYMKEHLSSSDYTRRRSALTVLRQYESIFCEPDPDLASITKPGPSPKVWDPFRSDWEQFLKKFRRMSPAIKDNVSIHTTAKNGPNGPAMVTSHIDALAVNQDNNMKENIFNLYRLTGSESRLEDKLNMFNSCVTLGESYRSRFNRTINHSRLQYLAVGGGKTRTIAIGDYFSQDALKPLHKWAYRFLGKLSTDGTSSHNRVSRMLCENTRLKKDSFCFDLTSATDRFPIFLQIEFLSAVLSKEIAISWGEVISKRKFAVPNSLDSLEYKCGQPMGLLSSWAVFALTHHAIVEFSAYLEGYKTFRDYVIIGDDVAIFNKQVASRYSDILELLEVPISKDKSISSEKSDTSSRGEIAKRLFLNGVEISPIPSGAIYSAWKDYHLFPNLVRLCQERGVANFSKVEPVHRLSDSWYQIKKSRIVGAFLFYPGKQVLLSDKDNTWNPWKQFDEEKINSIYIEILRKELSDKATRTFDGFFFEESSDPSWVGLMEDLWLPDLQQHPIFRMIRETNDKYESINRKLVLSPEEVDPLDVEYIFDPMLRNYRRKSHRSIRLKSILMEKTLKKLNDLYTET